MNIFLDSFETELVSRGAKIGESVQCGWFFFWIEELEPALVVKSLDFRAIASFTTDLRVIQNIHTAQGARLAQHQVEEEPCNYLERAFVSKSFEAGSSSLYMERQSKSDDGDSGWYVGVVDDPLSMEDSASFEWKSLYELTILDDRLASWWLFPIGSIVFFDEEEPRLELRRN